MDTGTEGPGDMPQGTGRGDTPAVGRARQDELDLATDDSLPWLESDDAADTANGVDTRQIVGFVAVLALVLALVVGAAWYGFGAGSGGGVEPDGSIIAAPEGPIRERPEDPGGVEFAGTGNVAPVVGEGGMRESVLATDDPGPAARTGPAVGQADGQVDPNSETTDEETDASTSQGVGVQLAAYRSKARAEQGWRELRARTDVLDGARYRIVRGTVDIGTVYRLQAVTGNRAAGDALCAALKADGLDCQVKP